MRTGMIASPETRCRWYGREMDLFSCSTWLVETDKDVPANSAVMARRWCHNMAEKETELGWERKGKGFRRTPASHQLVGRGGNLY